MEETLRRSLLHPQQPALLLERRVGGAWRSGEVLVLGGAAGYAGFASPLKAISSIRFFVPWEKHPVVIDSL